MDFPFAHLPCKTFKFDDPSNEFACFYTSEKHDFEYFPNLFRYQFWHCFLMCFCITLGSILAPFSHQSACFSARFSSLFRSCSAKGALWAPFPPFGILLAPFGSHSAPIRLPVRSHSAPFGIPLPPFRSLLASFSTHWHRRRHRRIIEVPVTSLKRYQTQAST